MRHPGCIGRMFIRVLVTAAYIVTALPVWAQQPKKFEIDKYDSRISFVGDTAFVAKRYIFRPAPVHHYWFERILVRGGTLDYFVLEPGWGYGGGLVEVDWLVAKFRSNPAPRKLGLTLTRDMVETRLNRYGKFDFGFTRGSKGACAVARQFLGESLDRIGGPSPGTEIVFFGYCRPRSEAKPAEVREFALEMMDRFRADDGELNRAQGPDHPAKQTVQGRLEEIQHRLDEGKITPDEANAERRRVIGGL